MLLVIVMPMKAWAGDTELKTIKSTFTGATYGIAGETYATGTLTTSEGNDWIWNADGESKSPILQMTEVGGNVCLSAKLQAPSLDLISDFSVPGYIKEVTITLGGNIGAVQMSFGDRSFILDWNYSDNNLHTLGFPYDDLQLQSTLPNQAIQVTLYPREGSSEEPRLFVQSISIETEVTSIGDNNIISEFTDYDTNTNTLIASDTQHNWSLALPNDGTTLDGCYPTTWNDEECMYLRLMGGSSTYPRVTLTSNFPVVGKVKKIIVKAGGDLGFLNYMTDNGEQFNSEEVFGNVPYYKDLTLDFGSGIEMNGPLNIYLYAGRNVFLKSITIVLEGGATEVVGLTSTFCEFELWDTTDSFKVGSMKSKESTPWLAFIYDTTAPVYMTSIQFEEGSEPEPCMVIGGYSNTKELSFELQNDFRVSGSIKKIIVSFTGHLDVVSAFVFERNTSNENQQNVQITPHEGAGFTDAEMIFDGTIEYTDAYISLFMSGREPIFLKSITIVQEDDNGGNGGEAGGKCGENLNYTLTQLPYTVWVWDSETHQSVEAPAYKLTITGTGDMYDYDDWMNKVPWAEVNVESLTEIELPDGITRVGDNAFSGCYNATVNKLPESLTSIGAYAFYNLLNWQNADLQLPNNLTSVGNNAFTYSSGFTNLWLPASLTFIGDGAFSGISGLENFYVDEDNPVYKADGNAVIEKATNTLVVGNINTVIPNYIKTIGNYAFSNVNKETILIPNSVTSIGKNAFSGSYITSVEIPSSVTTIGDFAFNNCRNLVRVTIGSGVTSIGAYAFYYSTNITDVICYADPEALTWVSNNYDSKSFQPDKQTTMHVLASNLEKWQELFDFLNVTFVGDLSDLSVTISPITDETIVIASSLEGQDLNGNIYDNIYYSLDASTGNGYMDGYFYITQTTDMSIINDKTPGSHDVRSYFTGIILKLAPGSGVIVFNVRSIGNMMLAARIGEGTSTFAASNKNREVFIGYSVTEPTYVYIYAVDENPALVKAYTSEEPDLFNNVLFIYSIGVFPGLDPDGIKDIEQHQMVNDKSVNTWFDLSGKVQQGLPAKSGIYIRNGRKVVVK
jgi:hypothetical protein